ncbi:hypothetical protein EYF80_005829 [Liparis tanakae]|uniref:Uncharacterized protein n=1 Tax=Liparis tanakae TaxID=230148 RepID=A0A4Z2J2L3_9TELE|nr:hypothetical protein EYF80_005829 [Liparis tanakae]
MRGVAWLTAFSTQAPSTSLRASATVSGNAAKLCTVDGHDAAPRDLVGSDGGDFAELAFTEVGSHVSVGLGDEKVEGFLAGDRSAIKSVAISHDKSKLHGDSRRPRAPLDEGRAACVLLESRVQPHISAEPPRVPKQPPPPPSGPRLLRVMTTQKYFTLGAGSAFCGSLTG